MTHDEAHKAAVEDATMAVFMSRAEGDDIVATAAITAYRAEMEARGFVVVPVEPTEGMAAAIRDAVMHGLTTEVDYGENCSSTYEVFDDNAEWDVYRAMLAARPKVTP